MAPPTRSLAPLARAPRSVSGARPLVESVQPTRAWSGYLPAVRGRPRTRRRCGADALGRSGLLCATTRGRARHFPPTRSCQPVGEADGHGTYLGLGAGQYVSDRAPAPEAVLPQAGPVPGRQAASDTTPASPGRCGGCMRRWDAWGAPTTSVPEPRDPGSRCGAAPYGVPPRRRSGVGPGAEPPSQRAGGTALLIDVVSPPSLLMSFVDWFGGASARHNRRVPLPGALV